MAAIELKCTKCGTRYRLMRQPPDNQVKCRKCGMVISIEPEPQEQPEVQQQAKVQPAPAEADLAGHDLGGYRLLALVDRGQQMDVYKAQQVAMRRTVAVGVLRSELSSDPATVETFVADARLVAAMQSPNIISIYDVSAEQLPCYFSMEYAEGSTIRQMVDSAGPPPLTDAVRVAVTIGSALTHALRHKVASVGLTSSTVMLTTQGEVKILPEALSAVEQKGREPVEGQCTQQLGALLYALLTGVEVAGEKKIDPPSAHNAGISPLLDRVVLQMLKGQKGYTSLVAATNELKRLSGRPRNVEHRVEQKLRHGRHRQKKANPKVILITLAVFLVCGAVLGGILWHLLRQGKVTQHLAKIEITEAEKNDRGFVKFAEEFIAEYPKHPRRAELAAKIEEKKKLLAKAQREEEARIKMREMVQDAESQAHLITKHSAKLDKLLEEYADVENIDKLIEHSKKGLDVVWEGQRSIDKQEIENDIVRRRFGQAYEKLNKLQEKYVCEDADIDDQARVKAHLDNLKTIIDRIINDEFIKFTTYAADFQMNGKVDKAIELLQKVVNEWGVERYAQLAQEQIDRLKHAPPPEKGTDEPGEDQAPVGTDTRAINEGL